MQEKRKIKSDSKVSVLGDEESDGGRTGGSTAAGKESPFAGDEFRCRCFLSVSVRHAEGFWLGGNFH